MSTKPEESREDERLALAWLDKLYGAALTGPETMAKIDTLKAMLAQPRLPEEPCREAVRAMAQESSSTVYSMKYAYRALYAHLTAKPKPTWTVTWHSKDRRSAGGPYPPENIDSAMASARRLAEQGHVVTIRCDAP